MPSAVNPVKTSIMILFEVGESFLLVFPKSLTDEVVRVTKTP